MHLGRLSLWRRTTFCPCECPRSSGHAASTACLHLFFQDIGGAHCLGFRALPQSVRRVPAKSAGRAALPPRSRSRTRIIAILIMSAAAPWIGILRATRSPKLRRLKLDDASSGRYRRRPNRILRIAVRPRLRRPRASCTRPRRCNAPGNRLDILPRPRRARRRMSLASENAPMPYTMPKLTALARLRMSRRNQFRRQVKHLRRRSSGGCPAPVLERRRSSPRSSATCASTRSSICE